MKKTETILIRISPELKTSLEKRASAFGMNLSEYIRLLILEDLRKDVKQ